MTNRKRQTSEPEEDFIYQRLRTAPGIKLETVTGGHGYSGRVWELLAKQVWSENARDGYRAIDHTADGAPLLVEDNPEGELQRISVSHTSGLFAVATLPPAPEGTDMEVFSLTTALGLDVEKDDRAQVLKVRERFLNPEEINSISDTDLQKNIIAWTCKEAMLKLSLNPRADIRKDLVIKRLPNPDNSEGLGEVTLPDGTSIEVTLWTIRLDSSFIITLAYTQSTLNYLK